MNLRFLVLIPLCLMLWGCSSSSSEEIELPDAEYSEAFSEISVSAEEVVSEEKIPDVICVHVCGEVVSPGVYELPYGSRIYEALALAGGLTEEADGAAINQAESLSDGVKIYVPALGEELTDTNRQASAQTEQDDRININTADTAKLQEIKGIGASRAEDIINYRESNGRFNTIEDIMKVPGIKQGMFLKIRDQIRV
ncbi:MAG: helix-hairpin-helix domain-containing protein [Lachnospiraceae bacterium]|nr:helix-hairpin-helix domain-containing protein [Lachnospiraceae bacterium]